MRAREEEKNTHENENEWGLSWIKGLRGKEQT